MPGVVAPLVGRNTRPVAGLGSGPGFREGLAKRLEALLRLTIVPMLEVELPQPELQLSQEVVNRQKAFDAMSLDSFRIQNDLCRSPLRVESLEGLLLFLDVRLHGHEDGGNGLNDASVGVDLGLQPSAPPSHWRRAEVDENRLPRGLGLCHSSVNVLQPVDFRHEDLL